MRGAEAAAANKPLVIVGEDKVRTSVWSTLTQARFLFALRIPQQQACRIGRPRGDRQLSTIRREGYVRDQLTADLELANQFRAIQAPHLHHRRPLVFVHQPPTWAAESLLAEVTRPAGVTQPDGLADLFWCAGRTD